MNRLHPLFADIMRPFLQPPSEPLEMQAYRKGLQAHDWFYGYSDDNRVWQAGLNRRKQLESLQKALDPDLTVWNSIAPEMFRRTA